MNAKNKSWILNPRRDLLNDPVPQLQLEFHPTSTNLRVKNYNICNSKESSCRIFSKYRFFFSLIITGNFKHIQTMSIKTSLNLIWGWMLLTLGIGLILQITSTKTDFYGPSETRWFQWFLCYLFNRSLLHYKFRSVLSRIFKSTLKSILTHQSTQL